MANTAQDLRNQAASLEAKAAESFDRCDTDGCVSQWCDQWSAREKLAQAEIAEKNGRATFSGLYEGDRRVAAKEIRTQFGYCWLLRADEEARFGRKFIPCARARKSSVQTKLGLSQRDELAPARAKLSGAGTGFSGLTSLFVATIRTGDEWGLDSELV